MDYWIYKSKPNLHNINKDCNFTVFIFFYIWRMRTKLHLGILIVFLSFLGTHLEQGSAPNQQIIIQFADKDITLSEAQSAIREVQNRLESLGAKDIYIGGNEDGRLKITYYSDADVERIQSMLSKQDGFNFSFDTERDNPFQEPVDDNIKDYKLNVSEIQKSTDSYWDFEGTQVAEFNHKSDRFNQLKVDNCARYNLSETLSDLQYVALKQTMTITQVIDNISIKFPEVRAGPSS